VPAPPKRRDPKQALAELLAAHEAAAEGAAEGAAESGAKVPAEGAAERSAAGAAAGAAEALAVLPMAALRKRAVAAGLPPEQVCRTIQSDNQTIATI
jgi:hypothetical protein